MGNADYSVVTVRASSFNGLMDPLLGFELFRMRARTFRPRPFAGISILTYLFKDSAPCHMLDTTGTDTLLRSGEFVWTHAGRGIVRAAFPETEGLVCRGLQLLLNVPGDRKQSDPEVIRYDVPPISGEFGRGTGTTFFHTRIPDGENAAYVLPKGWNATVHLLDGSVEMQTRVGVTELEAGATVALGQSSVVEPISFFAHGQTELLLFAGVPIEEPVFGSETMSMTSTEELGKAFADYEEGKMGFITLTAGKWQIIPPVKGKPF